MKFGLPNPYRIPINSLALKHSFLVNNKGDHHVNQGLSCMIYLVCNQLQPDLGCPRQQTRYCRSSNRARETYNEVYAKGQGAKGIDKVPKI